VIIQFTPSKITRSPKARRILVKDIKFQSLFFLLLSSRLVFKPPPLIRISKKIQPLKSLFLEFGIDKAVIVCIKA